jgi:hypothetical protein
VDYIKYKRELATINKDNNEYKIETLLSERRTEDAILSVVLVIQM